MRIAQNNIDNSLNRGEAEQESVKKKNLWYPLVL